MKLWQHPMFWIAVFAIGLAVGIMQANTCGNTPQCFEESFVAMIAIGVCAIAFTMAIITIPHEWRQRDDA